MQRNRFLGDMLSQLFDRRSIMRGKDDTRDIYELCHALMLAEGEVSGLRIASTILARYAAFDDDQKTAFFHFLNSDLDIDATTSAILATEYAAAPTPELFGNLCSIAESKRQEFLRRLNQPVGATSELVAMRVDLLKRLKEHPDLARTNMDFVHLLRSWFNRGFLVLKQISCPPPHASSTKSSPTRQCIRLTIWMICAAGFIRPIAVALRFSIHRCPMSR